MSQTIIDIINGNYPFGAFQPAKFLGQQSNRATAEYDNRISRLNSGVIDTPISGCHCIRDQAELLIFHFTVLGNLERGKVGVRYPHEFCLSSRVAASGVGITEIRTHFAVRVGVVALTLQFVFTEETFSAAHVKGNNDPVPLLHLGDFRSNFLNNTHRFMPDNIVLREVGDHPVDQMQVRSTNGGCRQPDDDIVLLLELWLLNFFHYDVLNALISDSFHDRVPPLCIIPASGRTRLCGWYCQGTASFVQFAGLFWLKSYPGCIVHPVYTDGTISC
ncbi:hypothetical protein D3C81_1501680 [compost metagenome]